METILKMIKACDHWANADDPEQNRPILFNVRIWQLKIRRSSLIKVFDRVLGPPQNVQRLVMALKTSHKLWIILTHIIKWGNINHYCGSFIRDVMVQSWCNNFQYPEYVSKRLFMFPISFFCFQYTFFCFQTQMMFLNYNVSNVCFQYTVLSERLTHFPKFLEILKN